MRPFGDHFCVLPLVTEVTIHPYTVGPKTHLMTGPFRFNWINYEQFNILFIVRTGLKEGHMLWWQPLIFETLFWIKNNCWSLSGTGFDFDRTTSGHISKWLIFSLSKAHYKVTCQLFGQTIVLDKLRSIAVWEKQNKVEWGTSKATPRRGADHQVKRPQWLHNRPFFFFRLSRHGSYIQANLG
jgi:hypothetical protein